MKKEEGDHVNIFHARNDKQKRVMERIIKDRICPFCEKHLDHYHTPPIIKKTKYWILTKNMFPYEGAELHLLFINRAHLTSIAKLSASSRSDLLALCQWALKKYRRKAGSFLMRFGESQYTGASVEHLHAHLVFSNPRSKKYKPIKIKIA
jgi:ATP adenylyltransferase